MTNEQNFKRGDKVYMAYDPTISAIVTDVCDEGKYDYYVKEDGAEFTQGCYEYELLDRRTAFLTRLQSLMREYDVKIECWQSDFESVSMAINLGREYTIEYKSGDNDNIIYITPDNIMDFDKE